MALSAFRIPYPLGVPITSSLVSGCVTAPDHPTTAVQDPWSDEAFARTWSGTARLVGVFGVQANGVSQIRVTPPWASMSATFDRPRPGIDRTEIAWTCAFADPLRFGQLLVVAAQDRMEPESQIASTNASIPPLDAWHMDSDAAARSAARQSPAFARPLAIRQDYVVYAFYRPYPSHPATWFLTRAEPANPRRRLLRGARLRGERVHRIKSPGRGSNLPPTPHAAPRSLSNEWGRKKRRGVSDIGGRHGDGSGKKPADPFGDAAVELSPACTGRARRQSPSKLAPSNTTKLGASLVKATVRSLRG